MIGAGVELAGYAALKVQGSRGRPAPASGKLASPKTRLLAHSPNDLEGVYLEVALVLVPSVLASLRKGVGVSILFPSALPRGCANRRVAVHGLTPVEYLQGVPSIGSKRSHIHDTTETLPEQSGNRSRK